VEVVGYLSPPGWGLNYAYDRGVLPPPPLDHGTCQMVHGGS